MNLDDWRLRAYHTCGHVIEYIPHNSISFLTDFTYYCPKCGKQYEREDLEPFVGKKVFCGKWWNPLTWGKHKWIEKE